MLYFKYNTELYNFQYMFQKILECRDLSKVHRHYKQEEILSKDKDQSTEIHRKFYDYIDSEQEQFTTMYRGFIKNIIKPIFKEDLVCQKFPTFRAHLPDNVAVFAFHKDKDYNHPKQEKNIFLPITNALGTNTIWAESVENKGDFSPINANYGDFVLWDGNSLSHGSKMNDTGLTRISLDFRVIPISKYDASFSRSSISKGLPFKIGGYYDVI